jgi:hypothetical protein
MVGGSFRLLRHFLSYVSLVLSLSAGSVYGRDLRALPAEYPRNHISAGLSGESQIPRSTCVAVHQTPEITALFNQFGQMGYSLGLADRCDIYCSEAGIPCSDFESPPGSGVEYLFWGGIWIGGVVGGDTLVSVSIDGWSNNSSYFWPATSGGGTSIGLRPIPSPADFAVRTLVSDTVLPPPNHNPYLYDPMRLELAMRSHTWHMAPGNKAVLYDVIIRNIGTESIRDGCVAIFIDSDIGDWDNVDHPLDDITGTLRGEGIAYIIDNDGDPGYFGFVPKSARRLMAAKFLKLSVPVSDTSYNWWNSDFGVVDDYGPRLNDSLYRDFGTGGTGTPEGAKNKYHMMSKPEWDFDQIYTQHTDSLPEDWLSPPLGLAYDLSNGGEIRFLLSIGKFDLPPDSSVRIIFTTFTGADVHRDPRITDFLPYYPDFYRLSLNFNDVLRVAHAADSLAEILIDPLGPVTGLEVVRNGPDSAMLTWDPQVFDNIDGYDVCLEEVDPVRLPHPGTVPPWLTPDTLIVHESLGPVREYLLDTTLNPERFYLMNVVMRSSSGQGDPGSTFIHRSVERSRPPVPENRYAFFVPGREAILRWQVPPDIEVDHFNVYRLASFQDTTTLYHPFYDLGGARDSLVPVDSVPVGDSIWYYYAIAPWATVAGTETVLAISDPGDSNCFVISAFSAAGFESDFSEPVLLFASPPRDHDILVLTKGSVSNYFSDPDSMASFYTGVLSGLAFDLSMIADSLDLPLDWPWWLDLMPYRLVIVDDDLRDLVFRHAPLPNMLNYLNSGGRILICGSLFEYSLAEFSSKSAAWHRADTIGADILGIDSVFSIGMRFYHDSTVAPYVDSLGGFVEAEALDSELPDLVFDTTRNPFLPITSGYWPANTAPIATVFAVDAADSVLYRYRSLYPGSSLMEGQPVGVKRAYGSGALYTFGVHLWYLNEKVSGH